MINAERIIGFSLELKPANKGNESILRSLLIDKEPIGSLNLKEKEYRFAKNVLECPETQKFESFEMMSLQDSFTDSFVNDILVGKQANGDLGMIFICDQYGFCYTKIYAWAYFLQVYNRQNQKKIKTISAVIAPCNKFTMDGDYFRTKVFNFEHLQELANVYVASFQLFRMRNWKKLKAENWGGLDAILEMNFVDLEDMNNKNEVKNENQ